MSNAEKVAYFSMEIALETKMPTYSGGLGVLAGDTIRSATDLKVPMIAVTLIHRKGYFKQRIEADGWQREDPMEWNVKDFLEEMPQRISVMIEGRTVQVRAWKYNAKSAVTDFVVPVYFLDTNMPENSEWDRTITDYLYGGDRHYRLCQEVVLGIGGVKMLRTLGFKNIDRFHMNEGHASLLTIALLDEHATNAGRKFFTHEDVEAIRPLCVFTTHTPVAAGHDKFSMDTVYRVLGDRPEFKTMPEVFCCEGELNLTYLALNLSHYVNGVSKEHGELSQLMFSKYKINAITNGVHAATWTAASIQSLFDRHIPDWRKDSFSLRYVLNIPKQELWEAHLTAKREMIEYVVRETKVAMDIKTFTIGFARRSAGYKRGDLLFQDIQRLKNIAKTGGPIQIIYAGKAHPQDNEGKELIKRIYQAKEALRNEIKIIYLPNYDMALGKMITSGVDLWLNTPQPPLEASGTSGMKAALNGVPSLSILDGWWMEGCLEGVTGWAIAGKNEKESMHDYSRDAHYLYEKLEEIISLFYKDQNRFLDVMRHAIALNGSFFNTQRMLYQYVLNAYFC